MDILGSMGFRMPSHPGLSTSAVQSLLTAAIVAVITATALLVIGSSVSTVLTIAGGLAAFTFLLPYVTGRVTGKPHTGRRPPGGRP